MTDRITELAQALRADVEGRLIAALEKKGDYLSEEVIHKHVVAKITDQRDQVIKRILGVDTTWSTPKVSDESPLRDMIDNELVGMLRERVRSALAKRLGKLDERRKLRNEIEKAITRDLKERMSWSVHEMVRDYAKTTHEKVAKRTLARLDAALNTPQGETK
jgi:hypothetical protein